MSTIKLTLPHQMHQGLVAVKLKTGINMNEQIRRAISMYLNMMLSKEVKKS